MEGYWDAGAGLKKMFIATIGMIICGVLLLICVFLIFVPVFNILATLAGVATIVFAVLSVVGLYQAGKDINGCKTAFILTIVKIVVNVIGHVAGQSAAQGLIFSLVENVLDVWITYYVCTSVSDVLERLGKNAEAGKGRLTWKIYIGCYAVMFVLSLLESIPSRLGIAVVLSLAVAIFSIVAMVIYMIFLYQSSNALQ